LKRLRFGAGPEPIRYAIGEGFAKTQSFELIVRRLGDFPARLSPPHQGLLVAASNDGAKIELREIPVDVDNKSPHVVHPRLPLRPGLESSGARLVQIVQGSGLILGDQSAHGFGRWWRYMTRDPSSRVKLRTMVTKLPERTSSVANVARRTNLLAMPKHPNSRPCVDAHWSRGRRTVVRSSEEENVPDHLGEMADCLRA
jgi:hypothetical protein